MDEHHVVPTLLKLIEILKIHDSRIGLYIKHTKSDQYFDVVFTNGALRISVTILDGFRRCNFSINQGDLDDLIKSYEVHE